MASILNVISSLKGEASSSTQLSNAILAKLATAYPQSEVKVHDLAKDPIPHLADVHFAAFNTPEEMRTPAHKEDISFSNLAIQEIKDADIVVIAVPV